MKRLGNLYAGQPVNIIGKGPSLQYLRAEYIGPGPVIAINQSIIKIEELNLPNPIFSMQKDGGIRKKIPADFSAAGMMPDCDYSPNCGDNCGGLMIRPKKGATLLVHNRESLYCFPDYSPRYVFNWEGLGLPHNEFSLILAVKIGQLFGCSRFRFICCDVHANGDTRVYTPGQGFTYDIDSRDQIRLIKPHLVGLDCEYITPVEKMGAI
jgi:hypothetical protein